MNLKLAFQPEAQTPEPYPKCASVLTPTPPQSPHHRLRLGRRRSSSSLNDLQAGVSSPPPPWQQSYLSLSPNGTLLRSLAHHANLTLTSLSEPSPSRPPDSPTPISPLRHVVDLLVLRAVLRQGSELLRLRPGGVVGGPSNGQGNGHRNGQAMTPSPVLAEGEDELQSYFRVVFEPEGVFMGPFLKPLHTGVSQSHPEGPSGSASLALLAPLVSDGKRG